MLALESRETKKKKVGGNHSAKIAVDAMGGDNAHKQLLKGYASQKQDFPDIEFQLYGKKKPK